MTNVYFVRHAEPDYNVRDDFARPLTKKGKEDAKLVFVVFKRQRYSCGNIKPVFAGN